MIETLYWLFATVLTLLGPISDDSNNYCAVERSECAVAYAVVIDAGLEIDEVITEVKKNYLVQNQ